jgi:hypothetical protein
MTDISRSNIYVDTLISPSYTTGICQAAQLPGISGKENNLVLFEFSRHDLKGLDDIIDNYRLVSSSDFDVCILGSSDRDFGYRREIHIWITPADYENANLMILLGYVMLGHPDWKDGEIKLFALFPEDELEGQRERLVSMIVTGRLPISANNIEVIARESGRKRREIVCGKSRDADLVVLGFLGDQLLREKEKLFEGYEGLCNILFVNSTHEIEIQRDDSASASDQAAAEEQTTEDT